MTDQITIALAQPQLATEPAVTLRDARTLIAEAGRAGAGLILFPESYPGPVLATGGYDAAPVIAEAADAAGIHVCWSAVEPGRSGGHELVVHVTAPDGMSLARYPRTHPATGDVHQVLNGCRIAPGGALVTFDALGTRWGVLVCSELWLPEVSRVLAVRGSEVLLAPAGGGFGAVAENWRLIAQARAIENGCHVALTQSLIGKEAGSALVAGPEGTVARATAAGLLVAELDLARARWLRGRDDSMEDPKPFRSLPGLLRARRPELYGELAASANGLYDYGQAPREVGR